MSLDLVTLASPREGDERERAQDESHSLYNLIAEVTSRHINQPFLWEKTTQHVAVRRWEWLGFILEPGYYIQGDLGRYMLRQHSCHQPGFLSLFLSADWTLHEGKLKINCLNHWYIRAYLRQWLTWFLLITGINCQRDKMWKFKQNT